MKIKIEARFSPKMGLASYQNAVPLLQELSINNEGETCFENLTLQLTSIPPFLKDKLGDCLVGV